MGVIARIIGLALLTAGLGVGLGFALFGRYIYGPYDDRIVPIFLTLCLGCVGGIIGAVAGAAREIVEAQRRLPSN
jgi:hypothetical protein